MHTVSGIVQFYVGLEAPSLVQYYGAKHREALCWANPVKKALVCAWIHSPVHPLEKQKEKKYAANANGVSVQYYVTMLGEICQWLQRKVGILNKMLEYCRKPSFCLGLIHCISIVTAGNLPNEPASACLSPGNIINVCVQTYTCNNLMGLCNISQCSVFKIAVTMASF